MNMKKTYHAKSELCFNVRMDDGYRHVAFVPHTMGESSLTTDDSQLQSAIERHRFFGTLITVTVMREEAPEASQSPIAGSGGAPAGDKSSTAASDKEPLVLSFPSLNDAKDYVAEQWGISRSRLKYKEDIERFAAKHGVIIKMGSVPPG